MSFEYLPNRAERRSYKKHKHKFIAEDNRKDQLFDQLNILIDENRAKLGLSIENWESKFFRTFSDVAEVFDIAENHICLKLENKEFLTPVLISPQVRSHFRIGDNMFVTLGFIDGNWWILDVISIGSVLGHDEQSQQAQVHFTVNPLCLEMDPKAY